MRLTTTSEGINFLAEIGLVVGTGVVGAVAPVCVIGSGAVGVFSGSGFGCTR